MKNENSNSKESQVPPSKLLQETYNRVFANMDCRLLKARIFSVTAKLATINQEDCDAEVLAMQKMYQFFDEVEHSEVL